VRSAFQTDRYESCRAQTGMAKKVDELPIYSKIIEFSNAVNAILDRQGLRRNFKLRNQITDANDAIAANVEEGFEQGTDRAFARYVTISKGSLGETIGHLKRAHRKGHISADELKARVDMGETLGKMLGGFIKYLHRSDFKDRGRHRDP
jgi:four helix bundle protein